MVGLSTLAIYLREEMVGVATLFLFFYFFIIAIESAMRSHFLCELSRYIRLLY